MPFLRGCIGPPPGKCFLVSVSIVTLCFIWFASQRSCSRFSRHLNSTSFDGEKNSHPGRQKPEGIFPSGRMHNISQRIHSCLSDIMLKTAGLVPSMIPLSCLPEGPSPIRKKPSRLILRSVIKFPALHLRYSAPQHFPQGPDTDK